MKVLIPILAREEFDEEFVEEAVKGAKEVVLLLVIDTKAMGADFGFAASQISQGNQLMEKAKEIIGKKRKKVIDHLEWGETVTKIDHISRLEKADKIVLRKYDNDYWKKLFRQLKEASSIEVKAIKEKEKPEEKKKQSAFSKLKP